MSTDKGGNTSGGSSKGGTGGSGSTKEVGSGNPGKELPQPSVPTQERGAPPK